LFFQINIKLKSLILGIIAIGAIYIQLIFNQYVFSEEFFLNCLAILLIMKFSELKNKNNKLSFSLICLIISVASLIKGQDILSTLISFTIVILVIINMYIIQQKELLDFNIKNVFKYLGFGLSIFPFIIIFYLVFPRAEINFRLFNPASSSLGIPDSINLGSFSEFSNTEEDVFTLINNNFKKEELYFRVKIFDYMEEDKSWRPSSNYYLFDKYKSSFKVKDGRELNQTYQIILEPFKKKWIPSLKNSKLISNNIEISEDYFNQIYVSRDLIDRKKQISFKRYKTNFFLGEDLKEYYTKTPSNISNRLQKWVLKNNTSTPEEFLNKVYKNFSDGTYYYNLNPQNFSGNDYENFFFNLKEGYCEYYAGTFVLLARLANIPSRIVTGYYGGELNGVGDFYKFKQKDTHAWAEVWLNDKGWVRIDPTKAIPDSNVRNTLNNIFSNEQFSSNSLFSSNFFKKMSYYFNYADFVWTKHLLSYDDNERKNFIKELLNLNFSKVYIWIFIPLFLFLLIKFFFNLNSKNIMKFYLYLILLGKRKKFKILKSDTIQQIYLKLPVIQKNKYHEFFKAFEINKYSNTNFNIIKSLKSIF
ncbi:DUF3488 and transglutaminase-like domain-containing protein, partial [Candidatus Pelagibacter sp.]|nr:DUF3488 and transglutaminase-like domain-containing protein [Candidatus Pelagibacter sp.]